MKKLKSAIALFAAVMTVMSLGLMTACGNTPPEPPPSGEVTVTRIALNTDDVKKTYEIGETFTTEGIKVTAYMSDDTDKAVAISECTVTKPDMSTAGNKPITVAYGGKSANYIITVNAPKAHECLTICPICEGCMNETCEQDACLTKCGDNESNKLYRLEAEDPHVALIDGSRGALNRTAVKDDAGVSEEIKERNKDIVYIGNFNANAGASIDYTLWSTEATTATLYASVCKRMQSAIFTQGIAVLVNDDMIERNTMVPSTGVNTDTWADFVTVNLGCISLKQGVNTIKFTNISADFGYNFDKILINSPVRLGWSESELIHEEIDKTLYDAVFENVETKDVAVTELTADTQVKFFTYNAGTVGITASMAADAEYTLDDLKANVAFKLDGADAEITLVEPFKGTTATDDGEGNQISPFVKVAIGEGIKGYNDLVAGAHTLTMSAIGERLPVVEKVTIDVMTKGIYYVYSKLELDTENVLTEYTVGDTFDATGLTAVATKRDGTTEELTLDKLTVATPNMNELGLKRVKVSIGNVEAEYVINIKPNIRVIAFEGENENTILSEGLNRDVCEPGSLVHYVGGFADAIGRKITFEINASKACTVTLYVSVSTNSGGSFAARVTTTVNGDDALGLDGTVPNGSWTEFATVELGTIELKEGKNVISFEKTGGGPGDGYNFDKMELGVTDDDVTIDWYVDPDAQA